MARLCSILILVFLTCPPSTPQVVIPGAIMRTIAAGGGGGGNPTFQSVSSATGSHQTGTTTPKTFTHAIATLSNGYIIFDCAMDEVAATITGVTFDGTAMSAITNRVDNGDADLAMFGLAVGNKSAGTYTVSVSFGAGVNTSVNMATRAYNNVNQTTPYDGLTTATGSDAAPTVTVPSASGELVIDALSSNRDFVPNVSQTVRWERDSGGDFEAGGWGSEKAGAASVVMSGTISVARDWAMAGLSLNPP